METIAQNRRNSALVRLLVIGLLVVGGATYIVANTHQEYAGAGKNALEKCEKERQMKAKLLNDEIAELTNELRLVNDAIAACQEDEGDEDPELKRLKDELFDLGIKVEGETQKKDGFIEDITLCQASL